MQRHTSEVSGLDLAIVSSLRLQLAFDSGQASLETHPTLPEDRDRHSGIQQAAINDSAHSSILLPSTPDRLRPLIVEIGKRWIDIDKFSGRVTDLPGHFGFRDADQQWRTLSDFGVCMLVPKTVFAALRAVITPEDNDRFFREAFLIQRVEQLAELSVGIAHAAVTTVTEGSGKVRRNWIFLGHPDSCVFRCCCARRIRDGLLVFAEVNRAFLENRLCGSSIRSSQEIPQ